MIFAKFFKNQKNWIVIFFSYQAISFVLHLSYTGCDKSNSKSWNDYFMALIIL